MESHNPSMSDSRNEFINHQQDQGNQDQFRQFYTMMMSMMKNPSLMQNMMGALGQQNKYNQNSRLNQDPIINGKKNIPEAPSSKNSNLPINTSRKYQRGKDVLKQYLYQQKPLQNQNDNALQQYTNMSESIIAENQPTQKQKDKNIPNPFDQKPIQSNYIEKMAQKTERKQYEPIPINEQLYREAEERPICGVKKNFNDILNQQLQKQGVKHYPSKSSFPEEHNQQREKPIKTFLKRGARQVKTPFNKPSQAQQDDENQNQTVRERQLTPKNNRSVSVNRVLNKNKRPQAAPVKLQKSIKLQKQIKQKQVNKTTIGSLSIPPKRKTTPIKQTSPHANKSPKVEKNKKGFNVFQDSQSSQNQEPVKSKKGKQVISGVYLTEDQIDQILRKFSKNIKIEQEKLQKLRTKYSDLCQVIEAERNQLKRQIQVQRQSFEQYKISEMAKIKNQRRVMERQSKPIVSKQSKQQIQTLKKQIEKQKQDAKKRDKNNKIIIQKSKKQIEDLKIKLSQAQAMLLSSSRNSKQLDKQSYQPNRKYTSNKQEVIHSKIQKQQQKPLYSSNGGVQNNVVKSSLPEYQAIKNKKSHGFDYVDEDKSRKKFSVIDNFQSKHESIKSEGEEQNNSNDQMYDQNVSLNQLSKCELSIKKMSDDLIQRLFSYNTNEEYLKYLQKKNNPHRKLLHTSENSFEGRVTHVYNDGGKQVIFNTGVKKEYFDNGYNIIYFKNGDIKQKLKDEIVLYYFKQKQVNQITFPNKTNIYRFQNGQVEFHFDDGRVEIRHPDGTIKVLQTANIH